MSGDRRLSTSQALLRVATVLSVFAALGCTRAAGSSVPLFELAIALLAPLCAWSPAHHGGSLVTVLVGIHWLVAVDDTGTPWVVGVAASIAVLHLTMAAASVGPLPAEWTVAMRVRWGRRLGLLLVSPVPVWLFVSLVGEASIGSSSLLVTAALLSVALALLSVNGNLRSRPETA